MIVFFDGVCNLCNSLVDFTLQRLPKTMEGASGEVHSVVLQMASLQGETAKQLLPEADRQRLSTLVVYIPGNPPTLLRESDAALTVALQLGSPWRALAKVGFWFPRFLRDGTYRWVAQNRMAWFGERSTCRVPTPEERSRLLP